MSLLDTASLIVTPNGYKEGKLYSVIPSDGSGDMSVTRATTATRVNSAGLVELVPYNLLGYSEDFTNASWLKGASTITGNTTTAPNGTLTADTFTGNGASDLHIVLWQTDVIGVGNTISVYAKKNTNDFLQIYTDFVNTDFANFNLANGTTGSVGSSVISSSIESVGNGWYRCSFVVGSASSKFVNFCLVTSSTAGRAETNSLSTSVFLWGAQLNEGTIKPYQKTETRLNIPRLDYSNGTCPSLLVEPQRTNLALWSSSFTNVMWNTVSVTSNTTTAPDGTLTADTYSASQSNELWQPITASTSTTYTISLWVKLGTATNLCLVVNNGAAWNTIGGQSFDSSDGLNTTTWTRISYTFTTPSTLPIGVINFHIGGNAETGLTQSTGTAFIWGAQLEQGSYATSYIPTTSASVTRNADVISKTGISSLIGQTEGTLFVEEIYDSSVLNNGGLDDTLISLTDGTSNNLISIFHYGGGVGTVLFFIRLSNTTQAAIFSSALPSGTYKIALAYKNNDVVAYINGVQIGTDTSASIPTTSVVTFVDPVTTNAATKTVNIKAAALWKTRLTNTQLAQLTAL